MKPIGKLTRTDKFILSLIGIVAGGFVGRYVLFVGVVTIGIFSFLAGYYTGGKR
jgi:hypothetical protein